MRLTDEEFAFCTARMPRPCVDILLTYQGKFLLLHRQIAPYRGSWALPGGSILKGETVEQAAIRKVKEEVGIDLEESMLELAGTTTFFSKPRQDVVLTFRVALAQPASITLDFQHDKFAWFPFGQFPSKIIPNAKRQVQQAREQGRRVLS